MSNRRVVCELLWRGCVSHSLSPSPFMRGERGMGGVVGEREKVGGGGGREGMWGVWRRMLLKEEGGEGDTLVLARFVD